MYWFVFALLSLTITSLTCNLILIFRFVWSGNNRSKRLAQNLAVSLISLLFMVILLELFFKLIFAQSDTFGFTLAQENWHVRYVQTNSLGYRDIEWTPELLAGKTKIMVLGDSFVEGVGIENPADRFADRLSHMLGNNYAVINAGIGGASTKDEIKNAFSYPYQPDVLILCFYVNDIHDSAKDMGFNPPDLKPKVPFLVNDSYALNFFYWRIFRLVQRADNLYWHWLLNMYDNPDIWAVYRSELLRFHEAAQMYGFNLIIVVFPEMQAVEESRPITSKVANLYREQGVPVLDVTDLVAGMDPVDLVANPVDSHPNEFVHGLVAEELYKLVIDRPQVTTQ